MDKKLIFRLFETIWTFIQGIGCLRQYPEKLSKNIILKIFKKISENIQNFLKIYIFL
jgi:hypothetical protein